jgi:hypothetical protein
MAALDAHAYLAAGSQGHAEALSLNHISAALAFGKFF